MALAILVLVALAAMIAVFAPERPLLAGGLLLGGSLCVLVVNALRAGR
jgi:hypothetical protein